MKWNKRQQAVILRTILIVVSQVLIICNLSSQELSESLLLNYNFENNSVDASANAFDGINVQTTFTDDRFGNPENAALFNGNSFVESPNLPILKPDFPFSVACWVNPEVELIRAEGIWGNDQTLDNYFGAFVSVLSSGKLMAGYGDGCGTTGPQCRRSFITDEILENGNWYHIAVNFLDPLNIEIYINGCLVTTSFSGTGSTSLVYSDQPGAVGKKDHNDDPSHPIGYFHGIIDDFFYWNRTINPGDLQLLIDGFFSLPDSLVTYTGCQNDGYEIEVNNVVYNELNPTGIEYYASPNGCEEVKITIDLQFNETYTEIIENVTCSGDGFEIVVNSTLYNESNPVGQEIFINQFGCDSILNIDLTYNGYEAELLDYEGWSGDGFEVIVNNTVYNENNPFGQEVLTDQFGCDSTIIIDLKYYKKCSFYIPNTFSNNSTYPNNRFSLFSSNECVPLDLQVEIFDSWGNLVFSSTDVDFEWDGNFNSELVKQGIYVYLIKLNTVRETFNLAGSVTFLR